MGEEMRHKKRRVHAVAATLSVLACVGASLQSRADAADATESSIDSQPVKLDEVIVTAQRREEKLLDVPMSISAITGDQLAREGATSLLDIASTIPGLSTAQFSPGQNRVQLRGISSLAGLPTVGQYLDETSINVQGGNPTFGADIRFIDLERVEVLRGPQATLYGEGSMGGTIRYLTKDPDLKRASVGFEGTAGTVTDGSQLYRGNVVVNVPLIDNTLAMRFAGGYEKSPGWIDYPAIGVKDGNSATSKTARLKTLWKPDEAFSANLLLLYQDTGTRSQSFANERVAPFVLLTPYVDKNRLASLVLSYDLDAVNLTSVSSYMNRSSNTTLDFTSLLGPLYPLYFGVPEPSTIKANGFDTFKSVSQELRAVSRGDTAFTWNAGVYYRNYWEDVGNRTVANPDPLPFELVDGSGQDRSESWAVYGEGSYHFTQAFQSTLGLRYYRNKVSQPAESGSSFGAPTFSPAQDATFTSLNPRLVLAYHLREEALVYASASKGFRSGGMNGASLAVTGCNYPVNYAPEKLWTYELGSNVSAAQGRVVLQSSVYYNDWKQIQELQYCSGLAALGPQTVSGGRAKGEGVDLQLTVRPLRPLSVTLSGSYNNSYYEDDSAAHLAGDRIDFVPRWTTGAAAEYDFLWVAGVGGRLHLDYQYTGSWSVALRNQLATATGAVYSDSYGLVNGRLAALFGLWEVSLFGQNLSDQDRRAIPKYGGYLAPVSLQPRTVGVSLRYNY